MSRFSAQPVPPSHARTSAHWTVCTRTAPEGCVNQAVLTRVQAEIAAEAMDTVYRLGRQRRHELFHALTKSAEAERERVVFLEREAEFHAARLRPVDGSEWVVSSNLSMALLMRGAGLAEEQARVLAGTFVWLYRAGWDDKEAEIRRAFGYKA